MFVSLQWAIFLVLVIYSWTWNQWTRADNATNYCNVNTCVMKPHTMCTYPQSGPSSNCYKPLASPLTVNEISGLVGRHNELRKKVADGKETRGAPGPQPPSSDMRELKWDPELARIAQRWADQCMSGHDDCRDSERFVVGQNIATQWSSGPINVTVEELVNRWFDEVEFFSGNGVARFQFAASYGHYTQLVWGNTSYLGCGIVRYFDRNLQMNAMELICNYGPAGNVIGQPVYKEGKAASACPSSISKNITSLCD